ncbi:MAG TPA: helix-turn-helix transcriptional regulator, partial [Gaiellaceae bacterium]|nr:helix-turn-helix transcriptional regulator [Gaiellaceae bacterium]
AATTTCGLMEIWGTGAPDPEVFERAQLLAQSGDDLPADTYSNPHTLLGARGLYRFETDEARDHYTLAAAAAEIAGEVDSLETFWWGLAQLEVRAGRYDAAQEYVDSLRESGEPFGRRPLSLRWIEGVLATYRGDVEEAREALEEALERAEAGENWFFVAYTRSALGFLELSLGDAAGAAAVLEPVVSAPFVVQGDPGQTGVLPLAAEAAVQTGALERARGLIDRLAERGRELDHTWCSASAARCRGLLLTEEREFDGAVEAFDDARALFGRVPAPFERARTMLALGSTLRRARRRRDARETIEAALDAFEQLGTPLWSERARSELGRVGGRAPSGGDLTPSEARVAALVSEGKTNREVAAALFVTDRTVESALTQIYRKLGVRSRTELARKLTQAS